MSGDFPHTCATDHEDYEGTYPINMICQNSTDPTVVPNLVLVLSLLGKEVFLICLLQPCICYHTEDAWQPPKRMESFLEKHFKSCPDPSREKTILKNLPKPLRSQARRAGGQENTRCRKLFWTYLVPPPPPPCLWGDLLNKEANYSKQDILLLMKNMAYPGFLEKAFKRLGVDKRYPSLGLHQEGQLFQRRRHFLEKGTTAQYGSGRFQCHQPYQPPTKFQSKRYFHQSKTTQPKTRPSKSDPGQARINPGPPGSLVYFFAPPTAVFTHSLPVANWVLVTDDPRILNGRTLYSSITPSLSPAS